MFNDRAAQWAYETVMKMEPDQAVEFVRHATYTLLHDDIAANRRTIDRKIAEINKRLSSGLADADLDDETFLHGVEIVSKAGWGGDKWNRNPDGKFAPQDTLGRRGAWDNAPRRVRRGQGNQPMDSTSARYQHNIPGARVYNPTSARGRGKHGARQALSSDLTAQYQQQYSDVAGMIDDFLSAGSATATVRVQNRRTGRVHDQQVGRDWDGSPMWDPSIEDAVSVSGDQSEAERAAFDFIGAIGGGATAGAVGAQAMRGAEQASNNEFADQWHAAGNEQGSSTASTYRRVEAGGRLLRDLTDGPVMSPAQAKLNAAARFAEYAGQYGPEAEKVIGPGMRRTAYRYRGTERRIDPKFLRGAEAHAKDIAQFRPPKSKAEEAELKAEAAQRAGVEYLKGRLPDTKLSELHRKSGKIPPSEGIILNRAGEPVVQAIGYADDHYLPFNLKNLSMLKGGSYVRSRSFGGPTTEDVYTGLVSGARSMTVVSNSGNFTIHFSDDFRGGRRYGDKAAAMVQQYAQTLDAVKNGQIERTKLDPEVRAQIREETIADIQENRPWVTSNKEIEAEIAAAEKDYKQNPQLTAQQINDIGLAARKYTQGQDERAYNRVRMELLDAEMEKVKSRFYSLDGEGYAIALEAMKEQFPYYIDSVDFVHRTNASIHGERVDPTQWSKSPTARALSTARDTGYVKHGYNRPDAALAGFYDPEIAGYGTETIEGKPTGKTRANLTDYQNWSNNPLRTSGRGVTSSPEGGAASPEGGAASPEGGAAQRPGSRPQAKMSAGERNMRRIAVSAQIERSMSDDITALVGRYGGVVDGNGNSVFPLSAQASQGGLSSVNRDELVSEIMGAVSRENTPINQNPVARNIESLRLKIAATSGEPYSKSKLGTDHRVPFQFSDGAYQLDVGADVAEKEMAKRLTGPVQTWSTIIAASSDDEMRVAAASLGVAAAAVRQGNTDPLVALPGDIDHNIRIANQLAGNPEAAGTVATQMELAAENIERVRRLKVNAAVKRAMGGSSGGAHGGAQGSSAAGPDSTGGSYGGGVLRPVGGPGLAPQPAGAGALVPMGFSAQSGPPPRSTSTAHLRMMADGARGSLSSDQARAQLNVNDQFESMMRDPNQLGGIRS